jgi:hypothetical protein
LGAAVAIEWNLFLTYVLYQSNPEGTIKFGASHIDVHLSIQLHAGWTCPPPAGAEERRKWFSVGETKDEYFWSQSSII